jgi:metallo-beta-lactamase family protein
MEANMKISFFGAARTVTGTRHLVEANGLSILLDCGLSQGKREESFRLNRELPFDAGKIDLVVLSHAHIDHSGNLPRLVKSGFQGDIICTGPTRDLAAVMLRDSAHIQESDIEYLNKKRERDNLPPLEPLYTADDAEKTCRRFSGTDYGRTRDLAPGVTVTFHDAGHILGSAFVVLEFADPKGKNKPTRLVFSGDLGRKNRPIIRDPEPCDGADVLIIESTYGDRLHEHAGESEENLRSIIADAVKRGGKVIVPSFAVGRTQELVYSLHRLILEKKLPETLPVFVDSPLAVEATEVFRLHPEAWDAETGAFARGSGGPDPFGFARMKYTRTRDESMKLNDLKGPAVIISASGMAESGRILHHLKHHIGDERSTILFVGFQAENTLGRRLSEGIRKVRILGLEYGVKARIEKIDGMSGHADKSELLDWLTTFKQKPARTFVVHGEEAAALSFAETLKGNGFPGVEAPSRGDAREIS